MRNSSLQERNAEVQLGLFIAISVALLQPCLTLISQVILGRAILAVQRDELEPAYFFTFAPDTTPQGSSSRPFTDGKWKPSTNHPAPAINLGNHRPYSSEENARLVRLRETEGISGMEIAEHFPGRNASSLQVPLLRTPQN
jgi:hypothetical protein